MNPTGSQNALSVHCIGRDLSPEPSASEAAVLPIRKKWLFHVLYLTEVGPESSNKQCLPT
jgi:hypothetical protein